MRLAAALRADPRVTLADSVEQADVVVEVGAIRFTHGTAPPAKRSSNASP